MGDITAATSTADGHLTAPVNHVQTEGTEGDSQPDSATSQPRCWVIKAVALMSAFFALGLSGGLIGPCLVDLEELLKVRTDAFSTVFTAAGLGYLGGSLLCGAIYDHFNYEIQFTIAVLVMGVGTALHPWPGTFASFIAIAVVNAVPGGFLDAAGQAYLLYVMKGHRFQEPFMQGLHALWSCGAAVTPLIVQPFLRVVKPVTNCTLGANNTDINTAFTETPYLNSSTDTVVQINSINNCTNKTTITDKSDLRVQYAFLLTGCLIFAAGLVFFVSIFLSPLFCRQKKRKTKKTKEHHDSEQAKKERAFYITCLVMLAVWFFSQVSIEVGLGNYVAAFAVKELGWTRQQGSSATAALWGGQMVGRLLSVPIAIFLRPRYMTYGSVVGTGIGSAGLLLVKLNDYVYWISVPLTGLAMSSAFGSMVLWASSHIPVTGVTSSVFLIGSSLGATIGPLIVGLLFDRYSPIGMSYFIFALTLFQIGTTITFDMFTRKHKVIMQEEITVNADTEKEMTALRTGDTAEV